MATKRTTPKAAAAASKKLVSCLNCLHADLHRYGCNPILASCKCKPQTYNKYFPYQVEVACFLRFCEYWRPDPDNKEVEQRNKVA